MCRVRAQWWKCKGPPKRHFALAIFLRLCRIISKIEPRPETTVSPSIPSLLDLAPPSAAQGAGVRPPDVPPDGRLQPSRGAHARGHRLDRRRMSLTPHLMATTLITSRAAAATEPRAGSFLKANGTPGTLGPRDPFANRRLDLSMLDANSSRDPSSRLFLATGG